MSQDSWCFWLLAVQKEKNYTLRREIGRKRSKCSKESNAFMHMVINVFHSTLQGANMVIFALLLAPESFHRVKGLIMHMLEVVDIGNQFVHVLVPLFPQRINVEMYVIQLGCDGLQGDQTSMWLSERAGDRAISVAEWQLSIDSESELGSPCC